MARFDLIRGYGLVEAGSTSRVIMLSRDGVPMHRSSATKAAKTVFSRSSKRLRGCIPESVYRLSLDRRRLRGSPSLVGRGIANPVRSALGGSNPPPRAVAPCACERTMRSIHLRHSDLAWSPSDLRGTKQRCAEFARTTGRTSRSSRMSTIHRLYRTQTRRMLGWTERPERALEWGVIRTRDYLEKYRIVLRDGQAVGYLRTRPHDGITMEEVVAPNPQDFRAAIALMEAKAEAGIATVNWITARSDVTRFRSLGYTVDGPFPDTTMAVSLVKEIRTTDLARRFRGTTG